ncbi:MAG: hypothetical protein ACT4OF_05580 [Caulobacteraceae bacterium]
MTDTQAATTRFCARVVGPLMLIIGAVVIARFDDLTLMVPAILQDAPLAFITGMFTFIAGMVLFAAHHHFGSVTAIILTILGGLTIVRGVSLLLAPDIIASFANTMISNGPGVLIAGGATALIGAWLAYAGWFAKSAA